MVGYLNLPWENFGNMTMNQYLNQYYHIVTLNSYPISNNIWTCKARQSPKSRCCPDVTHIAHGYDPLRDVGPTAHIALAVLDTCHVGVLSKGPSRREDV